MKNILITGGACAGKTTSLKIIESLKKSEFINFCSQWLRK